MKSNPKAMLANANLWETILNLLISLILLLQMI